MSDDDEIVNPMKTITEKVKSKCTPQWKQYESCGQRIQSKPGHDCEAWYFDYMQCLDKWRAPEVFKHLK